MRKTALALSVLATLAFATMSLAEVERQPQQKNQAGTHAAAQEVSQDLSLGDLFSSLAGKRSIQAAATAEPYCTRAIDINGAFCYVGCPEGCQCHVEGWFSQCCCNV